MRNGAPPGLVDTLDPHLCITRVRRGGGFQYRAGDGTKITAAATLRRLRNLVIPPMWQDVLISSRADSHIQAVGRDARGRKQYIYHAQWHLAQQAEKFARLVDFAERLPAMRRLCLRLIARRTWDRDKVLALMVLLLDETGIRIGNRQYLEENRTHGLCTLRRKHLEVHGRTATLHFTGKGGKELDVDIDDARLAALVRRCAGQPGYSIFRYQSDDGHWQDVDSDDVNAFIHAHMGDGFSCKDFRTWVGTRLVMQFYPDVMEEVREKPRRKPANLLVARIADTLGNTVAICRDYYIHPALLARVEDGSLPVLSVRAREARQGARYGAGLSRVEKATLEILRES